MPNGFFLSAAIEFYARAGVPMPNGFFLSAAIEFYARAGVPMPNGFFLCAAMDFNARAGVPCHVASFFVQRLILMPGQVSIVMWLLSFCTIKLH